MAGQDKRINDLAPLPGADVANNDVMPIVDQSAFATKKITFSDLKTEFSKDSQPKLPAGIDGQVLSLQGGLPVWIDFTAEGPVIYIGPSNVDNSWRFILTVNGLELQVRKLGVWLKRGGWSND